MYRHYSAILAVDDMVGRLFEYLDAKGLANNTIVVFASIMALRAVPGGVNPWSKTPTMRPYIFPASCAFQVRLLLVKLDNIVSMVDWFLPLRPGGYSSATQYRRHQQSELDSWQRQ